MLIVGQGRREGVGRRYSGRVMQKREVVYHFHKFPDIPVGM